MSRELPKEDHAAQNKIRLMTNLELWEQVKSAVGSDWITDEVLLMESELEWRLRKIGFLPTLPPKEGN